MRIKNYLLAFSFFCLFFSNIFSIHAARIEDTSHVYCVILAGGVGERLWPLSRQHKPKQFLEIQDNQTLLDQAIQRVAALAETKNIYVSINKQHEPTLMNFFSNKIGGVIVEPGSRNTGPAILLCCMEIYKKDPEAIIIFLPSDPFIPVDDNHKFKLALKEAIKFVQDNDHITLLGVQPTFPATGYGYIEFDDGGYKKPYPIKKFHEKPSLDNAQKYMESKKMLWNIGMFCGKASVFMDEYRKLAPEIYQGVTDYLLGISEYALIKSESIDYAIMEKSHRINVLPVDFSWCDVGNIEVFLTIKDQAGSLDATHTLQHESKNNIVDVPKKLVALVGVEDLCVVETDEVLMIIKKGEAEKVRNIVKQLKEQGLNNYL